MGLWLGVARCGTAAMEKSREIESDARYAGFPVLKEGMEMEMVV